MRGAAFYYSERARQNSRKNFSKMREDSPRWLSIQIKAEAEGGNEYEDETGFAAGALLLALTPNFAAAQEYYTLPEIREQAKDGWHETYTDRYWAGNGCGYRRGGVRRGEHADFTGRLAERCG